MKKFLLITSNFKMGWGGISSYAYDIIDALKPYDYDITVITGDEGDYKPIGCKEVITYNLKDLSVKNAIKFLSLIEELSPDIILNSNSSLCALISKYIPNTIYLVSISHFVNGPLSWAAGYNSEYIDKIISLSTYGKNYLEKKFKIKEFNKVCVIPNFANRINTTNSNKEKAQILNIVYPGGCSFAKSAEIVCHTLLKLLKTNIDFNFYWLGSVKVPGNKFPFINVSSIKDVLPNDDRIKHIGQTSRQKAREILNKANVFLLPSRGEGFPISLIEAMSGSCIPIISDAKHGSLDIIRHKKNGLIVKQGSVKSLYNQILDILNHHDRYKYIYSASFSTYEKDLNKDIWINRMNSILDYRYNHIERHKFSKFSYIKNRSLYKFDLRKYYIKDRMIQFYHFLYFKFLFIKYIV